jgi:hypothetical protein
MPVFLFLREGKVLGSEKGKDVDCYEQMREVEQGLYCL